MRAAVTAGVAALLLTACGGDGGRSAGTTTLGSGFARTPQLPAAELERANTTGMPSHAEGPAGAPSVLVQSGCLACHQIGATGNSGPGNNLSAIGTRRTASQIRRSLVGGAPAPMPSFRALPPAKLDALVAYLAGLGDRDCPDASDCG